MQHGGDADLGSQMPGIGSDGEQRLGRSAEQQVVDHRLVLVGDWGNLGRQREDQVKVADRQQICLAGSVVIGRSEQCAVAAVAKARQYDLARRRAPRLPGSLAKPTNDGIAVCMAGSLSPTTPSAAQATS